MAELPEPDVQQVVPDKDWVGDSCSCFSSRLFVELPTAGSVRNLVPLRSPPASWQVPYGCMGKGTGLTDMFDAILRSKHEMIVSRTFLRKTCRLLKYVRLPQQRCGRRVLHGLFKRIAAVTFNEHF